MSEVREYEITITRNEVMVSSIHSLFHVIHQIESDYKFIYSANKTRLIKVPKKSTKINVEYNALEEKLVLWRYSKETKLVLNPEEAKIYTELWNTAMIYVIRQKKVDGADINSMIQVYNDLVEFLVTVVLADRFIAFNYNPN